MKQLEHFNPFSKLRPRLGLLVFLAIAALAVFVGKESADRLTRTHAEAGRNQLQAIADTFDNNLDEGALADPDTLQRRINRLREGNETLHKISVSWHDAHANTLLVQSGHQHDPDGTKRDVTTHRIQRFAGGSSPAPIDAREYGAYREVRAADGAHYGEINRPIKRGGHEIAALELHYDLKSLDLALANDKRTLAVAAALAALTLTLLVNVILGRALFAPLRRLGEASKRLGAGDRSTRLGWSRTDEIGELSRDFDRMAEELSTVHSHLEAMALTDALTGLLNHRAFQERLEQELRRAEREAYPISIVALDVDHFKEVNDRWGHAAGDEALRLLAKAIKDSLRPMDVCGRVGGDEFMVAIVRATAEEADEVIGRLRETAARTEFGPAGETLTVSAGISEFPRHSLARDELMHLADGAMYWAKSSGRNRSYVYTSERDFALSPEEAADRVEKEGLVNTVHALAKAVDAKDGYTHSHSHRVARYAAALAEAMGLDEERIEKIRTAGVLHDVGKIGIPDAILLKPSRLSEPEFDEMRRHSELGRDIIAGAGMAEVAEWVLHLHERFDGRGYPEGLKGDAIPLESRILHVADALEAMTSSRIYRDALPPERALGELERASGTQFDPGVAALMVGMVRSGQVELGGEEEAQEFEHPIGSAPVEPVAMASTVAGDVATNGASPVADVGSPGT
jgi:diguanylate cyclase (GGDEF)-like protein